MLKLILASLLVTLPSFAGLPPTSTKGSGDTNPVTTFEFDTPNIPLTHTGTKASFGTIPVAGGGTGATSLTLNSVLLGNGVSAISPLALSNTSALVSNSSGVPSWASGGTANRLLRTDGTTVSFAQANLTTDVTGILPVANGGSGTTTAFTQGSVVFAGASGAYAQDNAKFFWDDTNFRLGIGTATPATTLQLNGQESWTSGIGSITHLLGPSDQPFTIAAAQKTQTTSSSSGNNLVLAASSAIAGSSTPSAAAGGGVTINAGDAGQLTSGSAAGGSITLTPGVNTGSSAAGSIVLAAKNGVTNGAGSSITANTGNGAGAGSGPGAGGTYSAATGNGGSASSSGQTAANSGPFTFTSGSGGTATSSTGGTGGNSGSFTLTTGVGGNATGASGTRNGGNSGSMIFAIGTPGTGASANGTAGTFTFSIAGTTYEFISSAGLVGINTASPGSTLHVNGSYQGAVAALTGNTTLDTTHQFVTGDATSASFSVTLPACVTAIIGRNYKIKKIDSSVNTVTIARSSSDTIDGATSVIIDTQYRAYSVVCVAAGVWSIF